MNKVILMGRLTRDPEVRYSNSSEPLAITRYSLAVQKRFKRDGEPDAEFINCVAFGKAAEFVNNYFRKGQMISVVGRLQTRSWDDQQTGQKRYATEVVTEEHFFAESRKSFESQNQGQSHNFNQSSAPATNNGGFGDIPEDFTSSSENTYDDLPFS